MTRKLLTAIFLLLCLAAYAPPVVSADGTAGLILGGSDKSPVKLEVFSDFECPACAHFFLNAITNVIEDFKGSVCVIYYEFPLPMHKYGRPAALYATAAARLGDQQKLLTVFKTLFADQDKWAKDGRLEASVSKALSSEDLQKLKSIMETESVSIEREVDKDIKVGTDKGINQTPTILLTHAGKQERVTIPSNVRDMYMLLSGRLNGLLK